MASSKAKKIIIGLIAFVIVDIVTFCFLLYSANPQWVVAGRTALKLQKLVAKEKGIEQGKLGFALDVQFDKENVTSTGTFSFRKPDKFRVELDGSLGKYTIVKNDKIWVHFKDRNAVMIADPDMPLKEAWLKPRFTFAGTEQSKKAGLPPAQPSVSSGPLDLTPMLESKIPELKSYRVSLEGKKPVQGFGDCYVLHVQGVGPDADIESAEVWVSPTHWLPVKLEIQGRSQASETPLRGTLDVSSIGLGPVPDDAFTFNPPADAQLQQVPMEAFKQLKNLLPGAK